MGKTIIVVESSDFDGLAKIKQAALKATALLVAESHDGVNYDVIKDARGGAGTVDTEGVIVRVRANL